MYGPELTYPCLYGGVGQSGFWLGLQFYPDHAVADQPRCVMLVRDLAPHRQTKVVIGTSGNFWLGVSRCIPRLPGHWSIYY